MARQRPRRDLDLVVAQVQALALGFGQVAQHHALHQRGQLVRLRGFVPQRLRHLQIGHILNQLLHTFQAVDDHARQLLALLGVQVRLVEQVD